MAVLGNRMYCKQAAAAHRLAGLGSHMYRKQAVAHRLADLGIHILYMLAVDSLRNLNTLSLYVD